ncbi:MAG: type II secretion system F family protein [Myxococcales bacterium]|nr:type II secretion system F family protein [Myxococcales bacterium]
MILSKWTLVGWLAALLVSGGAGLAIYTVVTDTEGPAYKAFMAYAEDLERLVRLMYMPTTGLKIALQQLAVIVGSIVFALLSGETIVMLVAVAAAILPKIVLEDKLNKRRRSIDDVLDTFLVALANALKVSPSLGDALRSTAILIRGPIKEDVEYALKEYNLGTPLDQALMNMAKRIESRTFSSAMATLLIGRQTGGDLPKILERSAATLREMARLEGVVRTKTAEGKSQAWVLGAMPFVMVIVLQSMDPMWLKPLWTSFIGYVVVIVAGILWAFAILAARKILNVDI